MAECIQCGKPAIVQDLCVEHYYMLMQANHIQLSWASAHFNALSDSLDAGAGYLVHHQRIEIPQLPNAISNISTENYFNISKSTVGVLNTGTINNLNSGITLMESQDKAEVATSIKDFIEAVDKSIQITIEAKKEILEQLDVLIAQLNAEEKSRSIGLIKSILAGITNTVTGTAALLTLWEHVSTILSSSIP
jgi:hypothetical protein